MKRNVFMLAAVCLAATNIGAANINPKAQKSNFESFIEGSLGSARKHIQERKYGAAHECLVGVCMMLRPSNSSVYQRAGGTLQAIRNYRVRMKYLRRQIIK